MSGEKREPREPYFMVPHRVKEAQRHGVLTFDQFALVCRLCAAENSQSVARKESHNGCVVVGSISKLAADIGWKRDKTTRDLQALRDLGYLTFEVTQGKRGPLEIVLTGALVHARGASDLRIWGSPNAQVDDPRKSAARKLEERTTSVGERDRGRAQHAQRASDEGAALLSSSRRDESTSRGVASTKVNWCFNDEGLIVFHESEAESKALWQAEADRIADESITGPQRLSGTV
jgi:hypothetical protein